MHSFFSCHAFYTFSEDLSFDEKIVVLTSTSTAKYGPLRNSHQNGIRCAHIISGDGDRRERTRSKSVRLQPCPKKGQPIRAMGIGKWSSLACWN